MRPTRGLSTSWIGSLPRERRMALSSIVILFLLLGAVMLYQRFQTPAEPSRPLPSPVEEPPLRAEAPSSVTGQVGPEGMAAQQGGNLAAEIKPGTPTTAAGKPTEASPERLSLPLAGRPQVLKPYGTIDNAYGDFRMYTKIAYQVPPGQPVLAVARGRVASIEQDPADGLALILEHSGGMRTRYTGLARTLVARGVEVEAGSVIARSGEPGPAWTGMGPHLAFEVFLNQDPVDPTPYLPD